MMVNLKYADGKVGKQEMQICKCVELNVLTIKTLITLAEKSLLLKIALLIRYCNFISILIFRSWVFKKGRYYQG